MNGMEGAANSGFGMMGFGIRIQEIIAPFKEGIWKLHYYQRKFGRELKLRNPETAMNLFLGGFLVWSIRNFLTGMIF